MLRKASRILAFGMAGFAASAQAQTPPDPQFYERATDWRYDANGNIDNDYVSQANSYTEGTLTRGGATASTYVANPAPYGQTLANVGAGTGGGGSTTLTYWVQVSGAYDENTFISLNSDYVIRVAGSVDGAANANPSTASSSAYFAVNFYTDPPNMTGNDYARAFQDGLADSAWTGQVSYDQLLNGSTILSVHPGEIFQVQLGTVANASAPMSDAVAMALGYADPRFYFDDGSPYTLSFSQGVVNDLAAPEPASWALMIGGFAVIGGAVRRRRRHAAHA